MDSILRRFQSSPLGAVEFLKQQTQLTAEQRCEVIEFELAAKASRGEPVHIEPYLSGGAGMEDSDDFLLRLILAEHRLCPTTVGEVRVRFPRLSDQLSRRLEAAIGAEEASEGDHSRKTEFISPPATDAQHVNGSEPTIDPANADTGLFDSAVQRFAFAAAQGSRNAQGPNADGAASDYRIEEMIAQGGMGVVYRAHQRSLNRDVALKMIRSAALASEAEVQRFQVEAEAAAKLNHPGIVPIYEVGESNGCPYFSMELVDGGSLAGLGSKDDSNKVTPLQAASLLAEVADAIHFGHEHGIIHRDIKPSNILLDGNGRPKVTDFGLAKDLGRDQGMTASGTLLGTPSYMAPEQALGTLGDVGPSADVYALGAVLYFLLTTRPPFEGQGFMETIQQVIVETPMSPGRVAANVDRDLATICMKCLEKSPNDRYASAADLAADLRRWLEHLPITARKPSPVDRLRKLVRRRPALSALSVALGLVVIVASISLTRSWWKTRTMEESLAAQTGQLKKTKGELATEIVKTRRLEAGERQRAEQDLRNQYAGKLRELEEAWAAAELQPMRRLLDEMREGEISELRGVEWFIHDHRAHADLLTLNLRNPLQQVAINRAGTRVVALTTNATLWDTTSGKRINEWALPMSAAAFDGSGDTVAVCQKLTDGRALVRICSANDGRQQSSFEGETHVTCLSFAGERIVLAQGAKLTVCDLDGSNRADLVGHAGRIVDLAIHAASLTAVTTSDDNTVRVWDLQRGVEIRRLEEAERVACLDVHADGVQLVGAQAGAVSIWNLQTGKKLKSYEPQPEPIRAICIGDPTRDLLFTSSDRVIQAWGFQDGEKLWTNKGHERDIVAVALSGPQTGLLVSAAADGKVKLWSGRFPSQRHQLVRAAASPTAIDFSYRGEMLARGLDSGEVQCIAVPDGQTMHQFSTSGGAVRDLRFSPAANTLAVAADSVLLVCPIHDNGARPQVLGAGAVSVAFDSAGKLLASGGRDNVVRVHDVATGDLLVSLPNQAAALTDVALVADGKQVLVATHAGLSLWECASGVQLWSLDNERHTADIDVRSDGRQVAVARYDGRVKLFELDGQPSEPVRILAGHTAGVTAVRYSPDGRRLATASTDSTVRIWQAADGVELLALSDHPGAAIGVALQPGNRYLASISEIGLDYLYGPECRTGIEGMDSRARQRLTQLIDRDSAPAVYYRLRALARTAAADTDGADEDIAEYRQRLSLLGDGAGDSTHAKPSAEGGKLPQQTLEARQESLFRRGAGAAEQGNYEEALDAYREAFALAEVNDGWKNTEYALLLRQAGERRAYEKLCRDFQRRHPDSVYVGRLFMLGEHPQAAIDEGAKSAEAAVLADVQPWNQFMLGAVHFRAGRFAQAEDFVRISMQAPDYRVYRWLYLSMILTRRQRLPEARDYFEKADGWLKLAKAGTPPPDGDGPNVRTWSHRLELELLRLEAAQLLSE